MDPLERRSLGDSGLRVTSLGLGGAGLGDIYGPVTDSEAVSTVARAVTLGIRYVDTAPLYGNGRSETRVGRYFASHGKPADLVISTKVGRIARPESGGRQEPLPDYTSEGALKSFGDSMQRLGLDAVDILYIHDPDDYYEQAITGAYKALAELRQTGRVRAIGAGMNQWEMEMRFAKEGDFDCFLQAGKYTLLDQSAQEKFLPYCQERGIGVVAGAPFSYGILAADLRHGATPSSRFVAPALVEKARGMDAVCARHDVPLRAVALQFILAHPAISSVIPGARNEKEMQENFDLIKLDIPASLWDDLKREKLIPEKSLVP